MDINDVPKNKWFELGRENEYGYRRFLYVTDIVNGGRRLHMDVSKNNNHPKFKGGNSFLTDPGFWLSHSKGEINLSEPPEVERLQRECIISIWENLDGIR